MMEASLYLPLSKYLFPLSTYFLETTRDLYCKRPAGSGKAPSPTNEDAKLTSYLLKIPSLGFLVPSGPGSSVIRCSVVRSLNRSTDEPSASAVRTEEPKNRPS